MNEYKYTVQRQWKEFLQRAGLEEGLMPVDQRREMRRAFYGAWGQSLVHGRDEIAVLEDGEAVRVFEGQLKEVVDFWVEEAGRRN